MGLAFWISSNRYHFLSTADIYLSDNSISLAWSIYRGGIGDISATISFF
jgi:hypothetical protein